MILIEDIELIRKSSENHIEIGVANNKYIFSNFTARDSCFDNLTLLWKQFNTKSYFTSDTIDRVPEKKEDEEIEFERYDSLLRIQDCDHDHSKRSILVNHKFPVSLSRLFNLIYGPDKFMDNFMAKKEFTNIQKHSWQINNDSTAQITFENAIRGYSRELQFEMNAGMIGSKTKILIVDKTKDFICTKAVTKNSRVPFSHLYCIIIYTCMKSVSENECEIEISFEVKFYPGVFLLIKKPIELGVKARFEEYYNELVVSLKEFLQTETIFTSTQTLLSSEVDISKNSCNKADSDVKKEYGIDSMLIIVVIALMVVQILALAFFNSKIGELKYEILGLKKQMSLL
jgi:hypothetical protein